MIDEAGRLQPLRYRDFRLTLSNVSVDDATASFRVWVTDEMHQGEAPTVELDIADMDAVMSRLERGRPGREGLRSLGLTLGRLALPEQRTTGNTVRERFLVAASALSSGEGLRLRLEIEDPWLSQLPWEYLALQEARGEQRDTDFLALRPDVSIVRSERLPPRRLGPPERDTARIVAALAAPDGEQELDLGRDRAAINEAIEDLNTEAGRKLFDLALADPAFPAQLDPLLEEPAEVFHFSGHGLFESGLGSEGVLLLVKSDDDASAVRLGSQKLGVALASAGVRLAVLGACDSGRRNGTDVWSGVAATLAHAGIPAIIGNQFRIRDGAAGTLIAKVYPRILAGVTVDEAVAVARRAIYLQSGASSPDWGVPVLYLNHDSGRLFPSPDELTVERVADAMRAAAALDGGGTERFRDWVGKSVTVVQAGTLVQNVGVQAGEINGNVVVNQIDVDLYAMHPADRTTLDEYADDRTSSPYQSFAPFDFATRHEFVRDDLVAEGRKRLASSDVLVLHGPAASGKTSLAMAGITPDLVAAGAMVARTAEYTDPAQTLAAQIENQSVLDVEVRRSPRLAEVVAALKSGTGNGTVVWILDQLERLFDLDEAAQERFSEQFREVLADLDGVKLVIACRDDELGRLARLNPSPEPDWQYVPVEMLSPEEARASVVEPISRLGKAIQFDPPVIDTLIHDLQDMSEGPSIEPLFLQIACDWLYRRAGADDTNRVTLELYGEGADWIVEQAVQELLESRFAAETKVVRAILTSEDLRIDDRWAAIDELVAEKPPDLDLLMERIVRAGLLVRRTRVVDEYQYPSEALAAMVERLLGDRAAREREARSTLELVWREWLAGRLASRGQLRFLAAMDQALAPGLHELALLIRSALTRRQPVAPWLAKLSAYRAAIEELDRPGTTVAAGSRYGRLLTGTTTTPVNPTAPDVGPLGWTAIHGASSVDRLLAGLLLAAKSDFVDSLALSCSALATSEPRAARWRELRLWAELEGAGAAPPAYSGLGAAKQRRIAGLITWNRIRSGQGRLVRVAALVGAAVGFAVGFLHGLVAGPLLTDEAGVPTFQFQFIWAGVPAAALAATLVGIRELTGRPLRVAVLGAGAAFGLVHAYFLWANGISLVDRPWSLVFGFMAGGALAWAVTPSATSTLRAMAAVGVAFALLQAGLGIFGGDGASLLISHAGGYYEQTLRSAGLSVDATDQVSAVLAVADAFTVGVVATLAARWAQAKDERMAREIRQLEIRAGDRGPEEEP